MGLNMAFEVDGIKQDVLEATARHEQKVIK